MDEAMDVIHTKSSDGSSSCGKRKLVDDRLLTTKQFDSFVETITGFDDVINKKQPEAVCESVFKRTGERSQILPDNSDTLRATIPAKYGEFER